MKLLLAILRFLTQKVVAITVIVVVLVLATVGWNWWRQQDDLHGHLGESRQAVESAMRDWESRRRELLDVEVQLQRLREAEPSKLSVTAWLKWREQVKVAESAVSAAEEARNQARTAKETAERSWQELNARVDPLPGTVKKALFATWKQIAVVVAFFLVGPLGWKALWYYGFAGWAGRASAVRLSSEEAGSVACVGTGKVIEVEVSGDRPLVTRMDWLQQYSPDLTKRTRFLFSWRAPFISFAAGLAEMTEIRVRDAGTPGRVLLTAASDPNAYLIALELRDHPGVVLKPGAVVALAGDVRLRTQWHLGSLHHWIAGRIRHIQFCGTGTVYVAGSAGVELCAAEQPVVIEEALVLGYDSRATFATVRTETFWPYYRDKTSLFDYRFEGGQVAIRQTASAADARANANPFTRAIESVLNGIGKLLGL